MTRLAMVVLTLLAVARASLPAAAQFVDNPKGYAIDSRTGSNSASPTKPARASAGAVATTAPIHAGQPARQLFGAAKAPAALEARAIGGYARGCLAGARPLAIDGPAWQAMRLSRNRNWGHPNLIALIERLAADARAKDDWSGLLVGDMSQPRGGPMLTGHASHQIGLDADLWLTEMPNRRLTAKEREDLSATSMLDKDQLSVDPRAWTAKHVALIRRAASYPEVERVLVHPAIKYALCQQAGESSRGWLAKVRPYWGHHYHMHIRMACPKGSADCVTQAAISGDEGCGKELDDWFKLLTAPPKPPGPPTPPITLEQLPHACKLVLDAPAATEAVAKRGQ